MPPSHPPSSVKASLRIGSHRGPRRIVSPGPCSKSAIACFRMCGYIWVFHCWQGSSREPIRENDPLDRQSLYTGTKFMHIYKAKGMPKACCGKSFQFQWVGYEYFRLSNPTAIFPLIAAVLSSKTEKIFTSVETIRRINGSYTALLSLISWSRRSGLNRRPADYETRRDPAPRRGFTVLRWTGSANI